MLVILVLRGASLGLVSMPLEIISFVSLVFVVFLVVWQPYKSSVNNLVVILKVVVVLMMGLWCCARPTVESITEASMERNIFMVFLLVLLVTVTISIIRSIVVIVRTCK